jgi:hypothetical protein
MTSSIASPSPASSSTRPSVPVGYRAGEPPSVTLAITSLRDPDAPGPTIYVSLIVDSGASVSVLGKEHLRDLGIRQRGAQAEIVPDSEPALGVKSRFATWYSSVPLRGQVVLPLAPESTPYPSANWTPWGPPFDLEPRFASHAPSLAGRRDFFRSFVVTFVEDAEAPSYILTQR